MASQTEVAHKSEIADKDDQIAKIHSDMRVLEERLANAQMQVLWVFSITSLWYILHLNSNILKKIDPPLYAYLI